MKLVVAVRLFPEPEAADALRKTLERCNAACDWLADRALEAGIHRQYDLHHLGYAELRSRFGLSAQAAVRCIAKVADAFKVGDRHETRRFDKHAAQPFDERIFRFLPGQDVVSIWALGGRQRIPFKCAEHQRSLLADAKGQVDLCFTRSKWMLAATVEADEAPLIGIDDAMGVDLGIVNLVVRDDGTTYSGAEIETVRRRHHTRRRALQKRGTRSARRALKRASGKQRRFQKHTNHVIAKAIVADAERDRCCIVLEDLKGIRDRVQVRRHQRARQANWGFSEERAIIEYKALRDGVPVVLIDPRNTSRECPCCGLIDKRNRPTRNTFLCIRCAFAGPADHIAALNIRRRGLRARSFVMALQGTTRAGGLSHSVSPEESRLL